MEETCAGSLGWNWSSLQTDDRVHKKYCRNSRSTGEAESKQVGSGNRPAGLLR